MSSFNGARKGAEMMSRTIRRLCATVSFAAVSVLSVACVTNGQALHPVSTDEYLGIRNYHFFDTTVGLDFFVLKSDKFSGEASVFIENRTRQPMNIILTVADGQTTILTDHVLPSGQAVRNARLPYYEWLNLSVQTDKTYVKRIRFDP